MSKLRLLAAVFAVAMLAACTDLAPTAPDAPQNNDFRPPCGYMGSGC